jgi:hypothetical protein
MARSSPNLVEGDLRINNIKPLPLYCPLLVTLLRPSSCFLTLEINHLTLLEPGRVELLEFGSSKLNSVKASCRGVLEEVIRA